MVEKVVSVSNLVKNFGDSIAVNDISFDINKGDIVGLVGPDGAGKTTLIRLLVGLLKPTSGNISIFNLNPIDDTDKLHEIIGYMPQKFGLYEDLTVQENLDLYANLRGLTEDEKREYFAVMLSFTNLKKFTDRLAGRLSGGMKQKLGLACSLLGNPKFLLLDEPGVGVDPISRRELMAMVRELSKGGMTILWSTSYLDEAENFDKTIVLNNGKILYDGIPSELTKTMEGKVFTTKGLDVKNRTLLRKILKSRQKVIDAVIEGDSVRVAVDNKKLIERFNCYLKETKPRFEDAVINALGGCPTGESKVAKNVVVETDMEYVIEAKDLTKVYGTFTAANKINFSIKRGEIFGLLGPNGAGKSTSFKMMCGLSRPTFGDAYIMGINMKEKPEIAREKLGYMAQKFSLFSNLTVLDNLKFFSGIYGLNKQEQQHKIEQMIEVFDLWDCRNMVSGLLPLGFKQRLSLACAIMHNPPILFLDEPTSGVDPLTRREFWNHINSMVERGVTVMVTTHFMDEAEYCDRIALIYKGRAIKTGSPTALKMENETMEDAFIRTIQEYDEEHGEERV
ncbi:MAG: ABC transporter ATP-binding protein [Rickettsiales bacterium]|nr:ABC transporter ATP-binding protein [Rickettsiales bacterium]